MTNEEIEKTIETFLGSREYLDYLVDIGNDRACPSDWEMRQALAASIRDLVVQAYEETARRAENWGTSEDEPTDPDVAFDCFAAAIRAEKNRLVQEPVASSPR